MPLIQTVWNKNRQINCKKNFSKELRKSVKISSFIDAPYFHSQLDGSQTHVSLGLIFEEGRSGGLIFGRISVFANRGAYIQERWV